jgi:hypothetical protein
MRRAKHTGERRWAVDALFDQVSTPFFFST